jgi:hypothetical protein
MSLQWELASPYGILIDRASDAWWSGRVHDLLVLENDGALLSATDQGGLWSVAPNGGTLCVSDDWPAPQLSSLVLGPDGPEHVYAAGGALHETDASAVAPTLNWNEIPLPPGMVYVADLAILPAIRKIVLVGDGGVWWSDIPPAPTKSGHYSWVAASGLPAGRYSGVAAGPNNGVVVGTGWAGVPGDYPWGTGAGIYHGGWTGGELAMVSSLITANPPNAPAGFSPSQIGYTALASAPSEPGQMYAAVSLAAGQPLGALLSSADGGASWEFLPVTTPQAPASSGASVLTGTLDLSAGGMIKKVTVAPTDSKVVAVAWGRSFMSTDGGQTWYGLGLQWRIGPGGNWGWNPISGPITHHYHEDHHAVRFDPADPGSQTVYVGSDGGIAKVSGLPAESQTWVTNMNRELPTLMFEGDGSDGYYGTFSPSYQMPGLIAGGLQDNGCVYCNLETPTHEMVLPVVISPWQMLYAGDGALCTFLRTGQLVWYTDNLTALRLAHWDAASNTLVDDGIIPIETPNTPKDTAGLTWSVFEIVNSPQRKNATGQLMYAAAGQNADLYGLFGDASGANMHLEHLGSVPMNKGQWTNCVASATGNRVFAGTSDGRIFAFDTQTGQPAEQTVQPRSPADTGTIYSFVVQSDTAAYAIWDGSANSAIVRLKGNSWEVLHGGLPNEGFRGLENDWTNNFLYAATHEKVYLSTDGGDNWFDVSDGLPAFPKAVRLRFVTHPNGNYIYLGTYGRSIWRSPAQTQPLAAAGTLQDFTIAPTEVVGGVQTRINE